MASDTSLEAAAQRLSQVGKVINGDWTAAGHKVGGMAKREAKAVAAEVTGGSGRLRNMGRGAVLGSGYELTNKGKTMTLNLRKPGPWVIMERGAGGHAIKPKGGGRGRGRGVFGGMMISAAARPAMIGPGYAHPISVPVHHPGMRQKRGAIRKTFARVRAKGSDTYHDEFVRMLGEIYG